MTVPLFFFFGYALSLAKQALLVEGVSQPGAGAFHVGPENLEVRSLNCFFCFFFCLIVFAYQSHG
jgi:hypothetical protein